MSKSRLVAMSKVDFRDSKVPMSILRNGNVTMSILRNGNVATLILALEGPHSKRDRETCTQVYQKLACANHLTILLYVLDF